jgi:hypothetical protein
MAPQQKVTAPPGISQASYPKSLEEDKDKVREYIKEDLFERVVFFGTRLHLQMAECCTKTT